MTPLRKMAALIAGIAIAAIGTPIASAQAATPLKQAELNGLCPQLRAQVLARAVNGNPDPVRLPLAAGAVLPRSRRQSRRFDANPGRGATVQEVCAGFRV
jgi:hypothetical protein